MPASPPRFISTRRAAPPTALSDALAAGLAPDGGLFVPETLPRLAPEAFDRSDSLAQVAATLLRPFFAGDVLEPELDAICAEAYEVDAPLRWVESDTALLELFHGPTAAFKDYGARFLAACLSRLRPVDAPPLTIVVATSGDTGAAVGGAFHRRPGLRVVILYPDGRVSPRQAHQLGAFGDNVRALRVAGSFDDCQALAKRALNDAALQAAVPLSSANSISLGRLLPQMAYYAHAALRFRRERDALLNFAVPTGNLGNALAAVLARAIGVPIGRVALATNANRVLPDYFAGADYAPRGSVATLANAMDVGAPSNFERLRWLMPDDGVLRSAFFARSIDDDAIRARIVTTWVQHGVAVCPHTATGLELRAGLRGEAGAWAVAATAHPAKFETIVEPLIGANIPPPPALAALLLRPSVADPMAPDYDAFAAVLREPTRA
jgi:threonine synthase